MVCVCAPILPFFHRHASTLAPASLIRSRRPFCPHHPSPPLVCLVSTPPLCPPPKPNIPVATSLPGLVLACLLAHPFPTACALPFAACSWRVRTHTLFAQTAAILAGLSCASAFCPPRLILILHRLVISPVCTSSPQIHPLPSSSPSLPSPSLASLLPQFPFFVHIPLLSPLSHFHFHSSYIYKPLLSIPRLTLTGAAILPALYSFLNITNNNNQTTTTSVQSTTTVQHLRFIPTLVKLQTTERARIKSERDAREIFGQQGL